MEDVEYREDEWEIPEERAADPAQELAAVVLRELFRKNTQRVFFTRQLQVLLERDFFHWVTYRAVKQIEREGLIRSERREMASGGSIVIYWHRSNRYYKRDAARLVRLVDEYSNPRVGDGLGRQAEVLMLEGFVRNQFILRGQNTRSHRGRHWSETEHALDFILERDGISYGVEVKNTLEYIDYKEVKVKVRMCELVGLRVMFAVRMVPKQWVKEIVESGGYAVIFKFQLYRWGFSDVVRRVKQELELPVDSPERLAEGTFERFVRWHEQHL